MAKSYHSTVFAQPADEIWAMLRDFGNYTVWVDGVDESRIEEGKSGDAVGAIRNVRMGETRVRQRLLAHSDVERFYTYAACEPFRFPVRDFTATIRVTPIVDGNRVRRMVGDVRLWRERTRALDRVLRARVCRLARIAAQPFCARNFRGGLEHDRDRIHFRRPRRGRRRV